jgi:prepilin-type N-terminal cleavage/methylation domain-containing protein
MPRAKNRGLSLVEVLVALCILAIGTATASTLATRIVQSNEQVNFQAASYEVFNRVAAEVQRATCQIHPGQVAPTAASADPGLLVPPAAWIAVPVAGSGIRTIGDWEQGGTTEATGMPMKIEYQVTPDPPAGVGQMYGFDVLVRIREFRDNAAQDNLNANTTTWIRTWPIRKNCVVRTEPASRGGWP